MLRVRYIGDSAGRGAIVHRFLSSVCSEAVPSIKLDFDSVISCDPNDAAVDAVSKIIGNDNDYEFWKQFHALVLDLNWSSVRGGEHAGVSIILPQIIEATKGDIGISGCEPEPVLPWRRVYVSTIWMTHGDENIVEQAFDMCAAVGIPRENVFGAGPDAAPNEALASKIVNDYLNNYKSGA